ncbi:hypothetical protein CPHO_02820 [Corynebacterium phocae]|uniref:Metallo-beta-lactamase domain-containing protein n=1 Tax=Corynebacterium phocae TaxID=161895 RepID=A0A1L7D1Q6_9CORY|nr:MBL fold metallo-hydrolase [Corynebacterium phocae]APT92007.1 hypothetical protein CPHO_02820 [Corynebacterium phocae]KAA8726382.1 MBL fold metallo-hydrolase [Corynebacterium phocae]
MKLTILGCSGSVPVPGNAASGYLVSFPDATSIIVDMGPGTLAQLQKYQDPVNAHVLFSHLHADHCLDFPSLLVWRRYHPYAPARERNFCFAPSYAPTHLGRLSSDDVDGVDDMADTFIFSPWEHGKPEKLGEVLITPYRAFHPVETYALRFEDPRSGKVIAYSGDTAFTTDLIPAVKHADYFLCEAAWGQSSDGKPGGMHMSGGEAGRLARLAEVKTLVLTHLQPWGDAEATVAAARAEFAGEIILARPDMQLEFR